MQSVIWLASVRFQTRSYSRASGWGTCWATVLGIGKSLPGGPDSLVGLLGVLHLAGVNPRLGREQILTVATEATSERAAATAADDSDVLSVRM